MSTSFEENLTKVEKFITELEQELFDLKDVAAMVIAAYDEGSSEPLREAIDELRELV